MQNRREFLIGASASATVLALGCRTSVPPFGASCADGGWKAAFRMAGFDPDAPGSSVFVITSDIHAQQIRAGYPKGRDFDINLAKHVAFWNAMEPKPAFLAALGDFSNLNGHFGDRPPVEKVKARAEVQFGTINKVLTDGLRKDVRRVYVVGNHDTYPGEDNCSTWREYFPDQPTYCAFDACGIRFLKWDGGVDGMIDDAQRKWIIDECAKCPKEKQIVVLVHQPGIGIGATGIERGIGRTAKAALADRPGVTWMLCGHEHRNRFSAWDLRDGGTLAMATHTMDMYGWWAYGVRGGRIVARIFWDESAQAFSPGEMPDDVKSGGEIPVAWQGRSDVVWHTFVGSPEEKSCRVKFENTGDNCGWLFYVGTTIYKFPKGRVAPNATRYAILGRCPGERKTKEPAKCHMSSDGESWTEAVRGASADGEYEFAIPPPLVGSETLWVKYDGFGLGGDEGHAGYAFLA